MSLFGKVSKLLSSTDTGFTETWINIENESQLDEIIEISKERPVAIFKHSTTCSISAMAKHRLAKMEVPSNEGLTFYYLDLLRYRGISNEIASRFKIRHESPQLLLIKDGKVVEAVSHGRVGKDVFEGYI